MMNPELNREYPEPGEAALIEKMVKLAVERMKPQQGCIRRGQHAKATGCVRGEFTIRNDTSMFTLTPNLMEKSGVKSSNNLISI
jgi:hypothetical protein